MQFSCIAHISIHEQCGNSEICVAASPIFQNMFVASERPDGNEEGCQSPAKSYIACGMWSSNALNCARCKSTHLRSMSGALPLLDSDIDELSRSHESRDHTSKAPGRNFQRPCNMSRSICKLNSHLESLHRKLVSFLISKSKRHTMVPPSDC